MAKYYNAKEKKRSFYRDNLKLRRAFPFYRKSGAGSLGSNWEGPYRIFNELRSGTFIIEALDGKMQPHPWNIEHLWMYHQ